jgi:hypothetical protein
VEDRKGLVLRIDLKEEVEGGREERGWPLMGGRAGRVLGGRTTDLRQ